MTEIKYYNIPVIILAAGESKRMGEPKGLLKFKGKPFIDYQISKLKEIAFRNIVIVLGKDYELYKEKMNVSQEVSIIINHQPEKGQFSSILCGLKTDEIPKNKGVYILPIDVPCPKKEVWEKLAKALNEFEVNVTVPEYQGKRGHPVLLSEQFIKYLFSCETESRLDYEIKKQHLKVINVSDINISLNLNTIEEWQAFKVQ